MTLSKPKLAISPSKMVDAIRELEAFVQRRDAGIINDEDIRQLKQRILGDAIIYPEVEELIRALKNGRIKRDELNAALTSLNYCGVIPEAAVKRALFKVER